MALESSSQWTRIKKKVEAKLKSNTRRKFLMKLYGKKLSVLQDTLHLTDSRLKKNVIYKYWIVEDNM